MADDIAKTAEQIWSMLDNMAAEDPESYKKFIDKQLKDGKEALKPPVPHMCIRTIIEERDNSQTLFINIMEWQRVPAPETNEHPIPVFGGPVYEETDKDGHQYKCVSVAFSPNVLQEYGRDCSPVEEQHLLICLAIDYLQNYHKVTISKNYNILPKSTRYKDSLTLAVQSLVHKMNGTDQDFDRQLTELEQTLGPLAMGCKDSLLSQLSGLSFNDKSKCNVHENSGNIRMPNEVGTASCSGARLIEELSSHSTTLQKPEFELQIQEEGEIYQQLMVLKIQLPGISSAKECTLDISEDDVYLLVPDKYELTLNLPEKTSSSDVTARFSKRTSSLILTLPIIK